VEDLARVIGTNVTRREDRSAGRCVFYTNDPLVYVDLEVDRQNAPAAWKGVSAGNTLIGATEAGLAGLGEHAFFGPRDRLYVLRGQTFLAIDAGFDANVRDRASAWPNSSLARSLSSLTARPAPPVGSWPAPPQCGSTPAERASRGLALRSVLDQRHGESAKDWAGRINADRAILQ
jgi:hypothetical protein